jgi:hypothetical protein
MLPKGVKNIIVMLARAVKNGIKLPNCFRNINNIMLHEVIKDIRVTKIER